MGIPRIPDSDVQFLARMLLATRRGDQITSADGARLQSLADHGYIREGTVPVPGEDDSRIEPTDVDIARASARRSQV